VNRIGAGDRTARAVSAVTKAVCGESFASPLQQSKCEMLMAASLMAALVLAAADW
jgi:hypothetical protein